MSIPRLEVTAAVISVNVVSMLKNELEYEDLQCMYYSDSEVVIGYINNESRRFHVYVGNRVQHIRDRSKPEHRHHIAGKDNPKAQQKNKSTPTEVRSDDSEARAVSGPLSTNRDASAAATALLQSTDALQVRIPSSGLLKYFDRFSSWQQAKLWVAWIRKRIEKLRQVTSRAKTEELDQKSSSQAQPREAKNKSPNKEATQALSLSVEELVQSEMVILRCLQYSYFGTEMDVLRNINGNADKFEDRQSTRIRNRNIKKTSSIYKLDPFIDQDNLLRVGGRVRRVDAPFKVKHPLIIPKNGHLTELIVRHFHEEIDHHQG